VDSTQTIARRLAAEGAAHGTVVVAAEQTQGRGRRGNSFYSPPGGLYVSIVLRPDLPPSRMPLISLAAGVAAAGTVRELAGIEPLLKWPNDVLVRGRKVCGILAELAAGSAILGMGLNVNTPASDFSAELRTKMTSILAETSQPLDLSEVLDTLLAHLHRELSDPDRIVSRWRATPSMLGGQVRVQTGDVALEGRAWDLDDDGALLLRLPSGAIRRLVAGEVHLLPT